MTCTQAPMQKGSPHCPGSARKGIKGRQYWFQAIYWDKVKLCWRCRTVGPESKQRQVLYDGKGKTKLVPISHEITDCSSKIRTRTGSMLWRFMCLCCVFNLSYYFYFAVALRPNASHGLLILEVFLDHTQRTTVGRTPLDEWSARRRDLYLTTHNIYNKHPCLRWNLSPQSQ